MKRDLENDLAPAIKAAHAELCQVIAWIDGQSHLVRYPGEVRHMLAGGCFDIALEHQAAIAFLTELELNGSAHALLRVLTDSVLRGMYLWRCASKEELEAYQRDEFRKGIDKLAKEIERALAAHTGTEQQVLSNIISNQWQVFCSFTHTGHYQITRRYSDDLLKPRYPDDEIVHALRYAGAMGLIALMEFAAMSNNLELGTAALERARRY